MDEEPDRFPFAHFANRRPSIAASSYPPETEHVEAPTGARLGLRPCRIFSADDEMSITGQDLLGLFQNNQFEWGYSAGSTSLS